MKRKIESHIENFIKSSPHKVLIIEGARQVGKSYIIREVGSRIFKNFIEINLLDDLNSDRNFETATNTKSFYTQLGIIAGDKLGSKEDTLVFLDEIQAYPHLLTMLKFLVQENRYTYIASGSSLGVTLRKSISIPIGSIEIERMYPMDFEEFLWANGVNTFVIDEMRDCFSKNEPIDEKIHNQILNHLRNYLITGGLPDMIKNFLTNYNVVQLRKLQRDINTFYAEDASQYDIQNKLKIMRIYENIPSAMGNKKKRVVVQDIDGKRGKTMADYNDEFDYLVFSGITLQVNAISNPKFPLIESVRKSLTKLYLNDVGLLTEKLYYKNTNAILKDERSINLGAVYETFVAMELVAHGNKLFYYDNKQNGEVDYLIDDYNTLSVLPIEVKSGRDYTIHSALNNLLKNSEYGIKKGLVLSNARSVTVKDNVTYMPIYYVMFLSSE